MYIHNVNQNTHTSTLWHSSQTVIVIMLTIGCIYFTSFINYPFDCTAGMFFLWKVMLLKPLENFLLGA